MGSLDLRLQVLQSVQFEIHFLTGAWMSECEAAGIKLDRTKQLGHIICFGWCGRSISIFCVTRNGTSEMSHLHPDLVVASGLQSDFSQ